MRRSATNQLGIVATPTPAAPCATNAVNVDLVLRNSGMADASDIEAHITLPPAGGAPKVKPGCEPAHSDGNGTWSFAASAADTSGRCPACCPAAARFK